jgi:hypothetical protein
MTKPSKPQPDRRAVLRYQVRKGGRLLFVDQPCFVECTIRDISEDGALLRMPASVTVPQRVLLWVERTNAIHDCEVRWRKGRMVGVQFTDVCGRAARREELERGFAPLRNAPTNRSLLH